MSFGLQKAIAALEARVAELERKVDAQNAALALTDDVEISRKPGRPKRYAATQDQKGQV